MTWQQPGTRVQTPLGFMRAVWRRPCDLSREPVCCGWSTRSMHCMHALLRCCCSMFDEDTMLLAAQRRRWLSAFPFLSTPLWAVVELRLMAFCSCKRNASLKGNLGMGFTFVWGFCAKVITVESHFHCLAARNLYSLISMVAVTLRDRGRIVLAAAARVDLNNLLSIRGRHACVLVCVGQEQPFSLYFSLSQ